MPLAELYNKTVAPAGRRLRKVLAAATSAMTKLHPQMWSSRPQDGVLTFVGPNVANITGTNTVSIGTIQTGGAFSGQGVRTYAKVGSWPGWLTLNTGTGAISGTAATGTTNNLRVSVSAPGFGSAQSNLFTVTIT